MMNAYFGRKSAMYKVSKFTFCCLNNHHELLLYNTLEGTNSFCKLPNDKYLEIFNKQKPYEVDKELNQHLADKGIIVEQTVDENKKLFFKIADTIKTTKLVLFINPTENCNFRCKYCYESFRTGIMPLEVQDNLVRFVKDNIHKYSGLHVAWFGGEPLLALDCIEHLSEEFIKICNFNKRRYEASMTTNGYLLKEDIFQRLLKFRIKQYQVTLDGPEAIHDKYRITIAGSGTFAQILSNIQDIKKLNRRDFAITIRSNLTLENYRVMDEYLALLEQLCSEDHRISIAIFKAGNWLDKAQDSILDQLIGNENSIRMVYQAILDSERKINLSTMFLEPGNGVCYAGKLNNYLICSDGSIHKCTVTFENPKTSVGKFREGKILLNDYFYSMISDFRNCKSIESCFNAPICMGDPCPVNSRTNHKCSYLKDCLDIILQILDKQKGFEIIS